MPMPESEIETLIKAAFPDANVVIEDLRGDGDHYACRVVSTAFAGKSTIALVCLSAVCCLSVSSHSEHKLNLRP